MTVSPRVDARELLVGITGHRSLNEPDQRLVAAMRGVRDSIRRTSEQRPVTVMSGLAEGVDRWALRVWLESRDISFIAVLPAARDEYVNQFPTAASQHELEQMLLAARDVVELSAATNDGAFEALARFLVLHADVVVAVWDGKPPAGPGGTGAVVAKARAAQRPLIWIHTDGDAGSVVYEGWQP